MAHGALLRICGGVQNARSTLENAIQMVESHPDWGARVVYGDTDSLFVLLKGRSRAAAFRIGAEIASSVTAANPSPVTLRMEKVCRLCILDLRSALAMHTANQKLRTALMHALFTLRHSCSLSDGRAF